jgi:hypothetical protein
MLPVSYGPYGNTALWVDVPTQGILPAGRPYGTGPNWEHEWGTKFPWWRVIPGKLMITARRLNGAAAGFRSEVATGYGRIGFVPSGLYWPALGCWQVTGTVSDRSLTIVVWVEAAES